MPKQRLEKDFRTIIADDTKFWYHKFQSEKLSYTGTPADYIILTENNRYLIECKENKSEVYSFLRSNQIKRMQEFESKPGNNTAYFLINFWKGSIKNSLYFLIPLKRYLEFEQETGKKSGKLFEFETNLAEYKVDLYNIGLRFE